MKTKDKRQKIKDIPKSGFTLLEMIVSVGIFSVLVISAIDITLGVSNAQLKTASLQAVQDNIRFSLELMTREIRTGNNYILSNLCVPANGSEISFTTSALEQRIYYLDTVKKAIMRVKGNPTPGCANATQFTAEEISVDTLNISLRGEIPGPEDGQPTVTLSLKVSSTDPKFGRETNMNLQTTVVQRIRDL